MKDWLSYIREFGGVGQVCLYVCDQATAFKEMQGKW